MRVITFPHYNYFFCMLEESGMIYWTTVDKEIQRPLTDLLHYMPYGTREYKTLIYFE